MGFNCFPCFPQDSISSNFPSCNQNHRPRSLLLLGNVTSALNVTVFINTETLYITIFIMNVELQNDLLVRIVTIVPSITKHWKNTFFIDMWKMGRLSMNSILFVINVVWGFQLPRNWKSINSKSVNFPKNTIKNMYLFFFIFFLITENVRFIIEFQ